MDRRDVTKQLAECSSDYFDAPGSSFFIKGDRPTGSPREWRWPAIGGQTSRAEKSNARGVSLRSADASRASGLFHVNALLTSLKGGPTSSERGVKYRPSPTRRGEAAAAAARCFRMCAT